MQYIRQLEDKAKTLIRAEVWLIGLLEAAQKQSVLVCFLREFGALSDF